ncbi:hypothetical protein H6CHR_04763 [Variovorax sp. PBL-H6]|nr:hypothetical protein H6CHR_04763 [Variovorax sp. PBL-H6]
MLLALAAVCFWIGLAAAVNRPLRQEIRALQVASASVPAPQRVPDAAAASAPREGADLARAFLAFLPQADLWPQQLQTLHSMVGQSGIELSRVEYDSHRFEHLPGSRLSVRLTMQAGAVPFRKFLHDVLVAMPNLAVERISTERSPDRPDRLNIRLDASLYYRNASPSGDAR